MWSIPFLKLLRVTCFGGLATACILGAGCSRPVGSVTGKVTYKDAPLKGGNVTFISTEGYPSNSGAIGEDGTYTIPNLTAGAYKVTVDTESLHPPADKTAYKGSGGYSAPGVAPKASQSKALDENTAIPAGYTPSSPLEAAAVKNAKKYIKIPESYRNLDTTDLSFTTTGGSNSIDLVLK